MIQDVLWDRAARFGWRAVETAVWRWSSREHAAGREAKANTVDREVAGSGIDGLMALYECGAVCDQDLVGVLGLVDERAGVLAEPALM